MMKLQSYFETAGKFSCLACCYIYAVLDYFGIENKEERLNSILYKAYYNNCGIDEEFTVYDPRRLMDFAAYCIGKNIKVNVIKKDAPPPNEGYCAERFERLGYGHFVLYKNGKLLYNSLDKSYCFEEGKPVSARIIEFNN